MIQFYLGTPEPSWLRRFAVPMFVSHARLSRLVTLPRSIAPWALDSGGFTEITEHGRWRFTAAEYVRAVARYDREVRHMEWAAPMDWMCEARALAATGLTIAEHQARTVASVLELREMWPQHSDDSCPVMAVLQGHSADDYARCAERYRTEGLVLADEPVVGLGSVCRRESTAEITAVVELMHDVAPGVGLHGFGVKAGGLARYAPLLLSADSQAWSRGARTRGVRLDGCEHAGPCSWCPRYALQWRDRVLRTFR